MPLNPSRPGNQHAITPSPAYTAAELNAPAGNNWLSHMGNLPGWRYSSLTQINKSNVATLKEAWHINLGTCPAGTKNATCGSLEANAVVADGTYYFTTPKGETFALDAATGAQIWKYTPTFESRLQRRNRWTAARRRDRRGQGLQRNA